MEYELDGINLYYLQELDQIKGYYISLGEGG